VVDRNTVSRVLRCGEVRLFSLARERLFAGGADFVHVVTVNAEIFVMAHENERLKRLLETTVNTVDGRVLQWICALLYRSQRIMLLKGADLIYDLAAWCQARNEKLFLLGSTEESNALAVAVLEARYPGLRVAGFGPSLGQSPFEPRCRRSILERVNRFGPQQLVVCFGPPRQEFWIQENARELAALGVRCAYGMGGTIDFISGFRPRAPRWMQFIGAEWLFRLICEPRARFHRTMMMFKMPFYALETRRSMELLERSWR